MKKKNASEHEGGGSAASTETENGNPGSRMDEIEIKLAFLEKELEEYKEASRGLYRRLNDMEEEIRTLKKERPESPLPPPEANWDAENRSLRT
jgi:hypothetical protein